MRLEERVRIAGPEPTGKGAMGVYQMPDEYPLLHRWPLPPNIRLQHGALVYEPLPWDPKRPMTLRRYMRGWRWIARSTSQLLAQFIRLGEAPDTLILDYARRWGVLALCKKHHRPVGLPYGLHLSSTEPEAQETWGKVYCSAALREPLAVWRGWARFLKAVVDIAGDLQAGRSGDASAWLLLHQEAAPEAPGPFLQGVVNNLTTEFGHLRPVALWNSGRRRFEIRLSGSFYLAGLPAALTAQLLAVISGGRSLAFCAEPGCGQMFEAKNRSAGRNAYCSKHGTAAARRAASRKYYRDHKDKVLTNRKEKRYGTKTRSK